MNLVDTLTEKIISKKAKIGIIGMGYVGTALADIIIKQGFETIGFVRTPKSAERINAQEKAYLKATTDISLLKTCDIILICVQTPVDENKLPDLTALKHASEQVRQHLQEGQLIIIESSIATGTTRNIVKPILEQNNSGLKAGSDFYLSFSPERVDPGNKDFDLNQIPKVVSGLTEDDKKLSILFYEQILDHVVPVSSLETAELVKLFENTFRLINISFVNELTSYTKAWNIDMFEVIDAASTKPFGFLSHYPSPGIGGHCIPVDPFYMYDDAKNKGITLRMIEEAGKINDMQPTKVVARVNEILQQKQNKKNILIIGLAYKPDIDDLRESASLKIWDLLEKEGHTVSYHDKYIPSFKGISSKELTEDVIAAHDLIIIATHHSYIDYPHLASYNKPILDTRHAYTDNKPPHVFYL